MFYEATAFNRDLAWDTSQVTDMALLFRGASSFNGDISQWNTGKVTTMLSMFYEATAFNRDLAWDTSQVTDMALLFRGASSFNGDISQWNTGKVTTMRTMFYQATAFNRDISQWKVNTGSTKTSWMFYQCPIQNSYKPKSLQSWC